MHVVRLCCDSRTYIVIFGGMTRHFAYCIFVFIAIRLHFVCLLANIACTWRGISRWLYLKPINNNSTVLTPPRVEASAEYPMISANIGLLLHYEHLSSAPRRLTTGVRQSGIYTCRACNAVGCVDATIKGTV